MTTMIQLKKSAAVETYRLSSSFDAVRKVLLEDRFADRLAKPLAYWALPNDRRLPLAFLGRTLDDLLKTPFEQLSATPGIGHKKITSLVRLLHRATRDEPPAVPFGFEERSAEEAAPARPQPLRNGEFDASVVSEALWSQWRETVRGHDVGEQKLGRLAPTLQSLPTVIWHTPLSSYLDYTVAEIRQLKTHGEKRVRVILEVFYVAHQALAQAEQLDHLSISLTPRFIAPLQDWMQTCTDATTAPSDDELREGLVKPLVAQIGVDAGDTVSRLAEGRLGLRVMPQSVRTQARKMGVTRARVYQLLEDCGKIMNVRWPEGRRAFERLAAHFAAVKPDAATMRLFEATRELFYPEKGLDAGKE